MQNIVKIYAAVLVGRPLAIFGIVYFPIAIYQYRRGQRIYLYWAQLLVGYICLRLDCLFNRKFVTCDFLVLQYLDKFIFPCQTISWRIGKNGFPSSQFVSMSFLVCKTCNLREPHFFHLAHHFCTFFVSVSTMTYCIYQKNR